MAEETHFKRFSEEQGAQKRHYFVMSTLHEDENDFEKSTLDITVTSDHKSWQAQGLKKPRTPHAEAMRRIYTALSPHQDSKTAFKVQLTEKGDILQVICCWKDEGKEVFQRHQPFELSKESGDEATTLVFDRLLSRCEELQATTRQSSGKVNEFKTVAEKSQKLVREFVDKHGQHTEELHLKFAAVLNEKKKRIRELESEIGKLKNLPPGAASSGKAKEAGYSSEDTAETEKSEQVEVGSEATAADDASQDENQADEEDVMDMETQALEGIGDDATDAEQPSSSKRKRK